MKHLEKTMKRIEQLTLVGIAVALVVAAGCTNSTDANEGNKQPNIQDESDTEFDGQTEPGPTGDALPRADEIGGPACLPSDSTAVPIDQISPIGFAPADVVAFAIGTYETTVEWGNGERETAEIVVTLLSQEADVIHFEPAASGEGPMIEIGCLDQMELPVEIAVKSDNGTLETSWMGTMTATSADKANVSIELIRAPFESILEQLDSDDFDEISIRLDLEFSQAGLDGEISGLGTSSDGPADDLDNTTVSAERFNIASF